MVHLFNGLTYGALLYLVAVGLVLIFGLRRIVNFAHGGLFMMGAYIGYAVASIWGFWAGLLASAAALAAIGVLLDLAVLAPLNRRDPVVTVLVTFGILLVAEDLAQTIWGKDNRVLAVPDLLSHPVSLFGDQFPSYRLAVIVAAVAVAACLTLWMRLSRVGLYVRASSVDPLTTGMLGVNTDRVSMVVVALGAALAGVGGLIAAPLVSLSPAMGGYILIESFIVVVVGGLGSFAGAFAAAIIIGQVHNLGAVYVPWAASILPFALMVAVLIWRPTGLAGSHV